MTHSPYELFCEFRNRNCLFLEMESCLPKRNYLSFVGMVPKELAAYSAVADDIWRFDAPEELPHTHIRNGVNTRGRIFHVSAPFPF